MTWTKASSLKSGDSISTLDNRKLTVKSVFPKKGTTTVYNFEVRDFHSYFVGDCSTWVHNTSSHSPKDLSPEAVANRYLERVSSEVNTRNRQRNAERGFGASDFDLTTVETSPLGEIVSVPSSRRYNQHYVRLHNDNGDEVGHILTEYRSQTKELYINNVHIDEEYRGMYHNGLNDRGEPMMGVGSQLLTRALNDAMRRNEIEVITGSMESKNLAALYNGKVPPAVYMRAEVGFGDVTLKAVHKGKYTDFEIVGRRSDELSLRVEHYDRQGNRIEAPKDWDDISLDDALVSASSPKLPRNPRELRRKMRLDAQRIKNGSPADFIRELTPTLENPAIKHLKPDPEWDRFQAQWKLTDEGAVDVDAMGIDQLRKAMVDERLSKFDTEPRRLSRQLTDEELVILANGKLGEDKTMRLDDGTIVEDNRRSFEVSQHVVERARDGTVETIPYLIRGWEDKVNGAYLSESIIKDIMSTAKNGDSYRVIDTHTHPLFRDRQLIEHGDRVEEVGFFVTNDVVLDELRTSGLPLASGGDIASFNQKIGMYRKAQLKLHMQGFRVSFAHEGRIVTQSDVGRPSVTTYDRHGNAFLHLPNREPFQLVAEKDMGKADNSPYSRSVIRSLYLGTLQKIVTNISVPVRTNRIESGLDGLLSQMNDYTQYISGVRQNSYDHW